MAPALADLDLVQQLRRVLPENRLFIEATSSVLVPCLTLRHPTLGGTWSPPPSS